ncbi:2S seed storage protein 3 [Striga hermonthica]|uniref:2S seed storage protein 3 n=1 Tax=Striga hermonthica TaxID=68872 RepID=A0A9N7NTR3_STRHE|nr:2S seed storage protein 3 [Striga hermonthica]
MAAMKIALTAALLAALVALAAATTYTTTVTTTTFADEAANPGQQQQCQSQIQGRQFRSCQRYLSQRSGSYSDDEAMIEMNPGQQGQESLRECCQQLQNVNEQCRCEAIRHAVRQLQQKEGQQMSQSQQVYQKATELPRRCNMKPQQCQIRVVFV